MDFGVVLQCNPPAWRTVELARQAELAGFSYVWTFDSHLLWEEPYVIYSQILAQTHRVTVGPMVTNPATRDWTVTASVFATLNEMFGNRTVCGIGRGDSAVRVTNGKPVTIAELRESVEVIRHLANGREASYKGSHLRFPWNTNSRLDVYVAAYGPKALAVAGEVGEAAGRDPGSVKICVAAPAYVGDDLAHQRDQCRWFGGMVGNHVADIVARYGSGGSGGSGGSADSGGAEVPKALTDYIAGRQGYDYNEHGRAGNVHADFVPDDIVDRFCILGPAPEHVRRLEELKALGVDQFAVYLQHDAKEATLQSYAEVVIPALADVTLAKS